MWTIYIAPQATSVSSPHLKKSGSDHENNSESARWNLDFEKRPDQEKKEQGMKMTF